VVEVLSPTSRKRDLETKAVNYGKVSSIAHYLVLDPVDRVFLHHRRGTEGLTKPVPVKAGMLALDPPGIELDVVAVLG
jgi:Uma2 family endonuclease